MTTGFDLTDPTKPTIDKSIEAVLEYVWNWALWLDGDSIATVVIVPDAKLSIVSSTNTGTSVTAKISGGKLGRTLPVTCTITTVAGRTDGRTMYFRITNR